MDNGKFIKFNLVEQLKNSNVDVSSIKGNSLKLDINTDGLELAKGSKNSLWPIQIAISNIKMKPIVTGIYYGPDKPKNFNAFMKSSVDQIKDLMVSQFTLGGRNFTIEKCRCILDLPALKAATYTIGHRAFGSCPKCTIHGVSLKSKTKMKNDGSKFFKKIMHITELSV